MYAYMYTADIRAGVTGVAGVAGVDWRGLIRGGGGHALAELLRAGIPSVTACPAAAAKPRERMQLHHHRNISPATHPPRA